MNCGNCGAPMQLFERRRYFFCRHCGTFHFLDAPEVDGVQVLARSPQPRACSICKGALARALLDGVNPVEYCQGCRGVLIPRRTFAEVITRRRAWATDIPTPPLPLDRAELERRVECPSCGAAMEAHPYFGPGNVVIDNCAACELIWLDFGELKQIVDAPGRDRGRREGPPPQTDTALRPLAAPSGYPSESRGGTDLLDLLARLFS